MMNPISPAAAPADFSSESVAASETVIPDVTAGAFDLAQLTADHELWLSTEGKEGKRANLRGLDLTGINLSGCHLVEASMRGTILTGANLSGADLRTADMSEAVLDGANLTGALLSGVSLARAQMHQAIVTGADLVTANFTAVIGEGINLTDAKLNGAILRDANFRHADLTRANLRDANLRGATMVEANLSGAELSAADCRDVNFDRANFAGARLKGTNFRGAKLGNVDLQVADFAAALDVAQEFQALSLQSERTKLQEEQAQLATWRNALAARENALTNETAQVMQVRSQQEQLAFEMAKFARGGSIRFGLWLVVLGILAAFTISRVAELGISRVVIIMAVAFFVLLLAFLSMFSALRLARLIKQAVGEMADLSHITTKIPISADPDLMSISEPDEEQESLGFPAVTSSSAGGGFGKKKK